MAEQPKFDADEAIKKINKRNIDGILQGVEEQVEADDAIEAKVNEALAGFIEQGFIDQEAYFQILELAKTGYDKYDIRKFYPGFDDDDFNDLADRLKKAIAAGLLKKRHITLEKDN